MTSIHPKSSSAEQAAASRSIVILDFGGQYAHLIANRVRRLGAYSEIKEPETPAEQLKDAAGIILSGGPQSVYDKDSPQADTKILELGIPVLGICYGHQWMARALGGEVKEGEGKEYGHTEISATSEAGSLLKGLEGDFAVWMSHGDEVKTLPKGFSKSATSALCDIAGMANEMKHFYGIQFHPEVTHTTNGTEILKRFVDLTEHAEWSLGNHLEQMEKQIKEEVGDRKVFVFASGGVDSTVAFALLSKALGRERVFGLLIDHGMMRKDEVKNIVKGFSNLNFDNIQVEDASEVFLKNLEGVCEPEEKRKIIGKSFLDVQEAVAKRLGLDGPEWMLGQGTIYPDTIETGRTKHADQIKTHHNRIDQIEDLIAKGQVIEPLKELYKDEVRELGALLGLPDEVIHRHPFPGPGLGVRILCAEQEAPFPEEEMCNIAIKSEFYSSRPLAIRSVGVQGDARSFKHPIAIFMVKPFSDLRSVMGLGTSIPNLCTAVNRVLLCTSHTKPVDMVFTPGTLSKSRIRLLQEADAIVHDEMIAADLYDKIWQFPVVLIPVGDGSSKRMVSPPDPQGQSIVLRPVDSMEAMTANASHLTEKFLIKVTQRLLQLDGIEMVFYDVTNKPPATIEWE